MQNTARILLTSAASILAFSAVPVLAQSDPVDFDIDAQPLPKALMEYSEQTNIVVMASAGLVEGKKSDGVEGVDDPDTALHTLLASTGLEHRFLNDETVVIREVSAAELAQESGPGKSPLASSPVLMAQNRTPATESQSGQTRRSAGDDDDQATPQLEEIVVTGSRIRGAQSASPVITISRQEIDQAGFATVEEIVENLPQNFGAGATLDGTNPDNSADILGGQVQDFGGGTSVNLRGLGASSTLVLLNGRRMSPSGQAAAFTNIASIPVTAIERVEVMTDGASAIYGSDAIGGVVNFILRTDYEGSETRLRYGGDTHGDTSNVQFGQSLGTSWDEGNVLLTYEYYDSTGLANGDRPFIASNDLSDFGGTDRRQPGGNPANIRVGSSYYAIPAGQDGTSLTAADFDLNRPRHYYNDREGAEIMPAQERHSAFLHLTHRIGAVELFGSGRYSIDRNELRQNQQVVDFNVTQNSPFFVDPTDTGLTSVRVDNYTLLDDFGPRTSFGRIESSGASVGVRFPIGQNWHGETVGNWSREDASRKVGNQVDVSALQAAVNRTDPDLTFNPFGDGSNTNPEVIESLVRRSRTTQFESENELWSISLDIDGEAFEIDGNTVKVAAGIDFREETLSTLSASSSVGANKLSRDIAALYAEVFVPLVSDANSRAGLQQLEVSLAARYEDYSDFGDTTNPKLGLLWSPMPSLAIRGTMGTSFRAPSLTNLDESSLSNYAYIPNLGGALPYNFLSLSGRNSGLQAEEAETWTTGFQWMPASVDGLSVELTYFNIDFEGRIETPTIDAFDALTDPRFASILTVNPTDQQIAAIVNNPLYDPSANTQFGLGPFPVADILSGDLPVDAILDNRLTNLAQTVVTGVELQVSHRVETPVGSFGVGLNGSYLIDFKRKLIDADPLVDEVDTYGRPVNFQARGNLAWSNNGWSVAGFVNYIDSYTDNLNSPEQAVDSWTTVDLSVSYDTGLRPGLLRDTRLSVTTRNLFDADPPFVNTRGGVGYDAINADPLGRVLALQITKQW